MRPTRRTTASPARAILVAAIAFAVLLVGPTTAGAHSGVQSYLYLDVTGDALGGRVELPYGDLESILGLDLDFDDDAAALAELEANEAAIQAYIRDHMTIGSAGETWDYDFTGIEVLVAEGGYAVVYFLADVPTETVPRDLDVFFDPFFDDIDGRDALLLIANDWEGGVIGNGEEALVGFDRDTRTRSIDLGDRSQWNNFTASVELGVDHIKTGPDHILFVFALLLPSVLVFTTAWKPVSTFGASLWRILKIVTMFTIAHSITFVLAGLDVLPLPPARLIESVIAASIVLTALHGLRPVVHNREWAIAFVFGLFHGMGFASLVSGLDVSQTTKMVSLLGRNVGIEIGQAVVVLCVFPALFLLRRTRWYRPFFVVSSIVLAVVAFGWMIERLFETDLRVNKVVDPIFELPRAFVVIAVITVVAALIRAFEARSTGLLATVAPSSVTPGAVLDSDDREPVLSGSSGEPR